MLTSNNLATVIAAAVLTSFLHDLDPRISYWAPFILAPITLVLGESLPKLLALRSPLGFARFAARPLSRWQRSWRRSCSRSRPLLSRWLRGIAGVVAGSGERVPEPRGLGDCCCGAPDEATCGRADADAILPAEQQMISRIFRFTRSEARKAMVPLVRVEAVPGTTSLAERVEVVRREGFSRLPVFHEHIFNIVGVVHVFDLLEAPDLSRAGERSDAAGQLLLRIDAAR